MASVADRAKKKKGMYTNVVPAVQGAVYRHEAAKSDSEIDSLLGPVQWLGSFDLFHSALHSTQVGMYIECKPV
jgi:hypothetical protein